MQLTRHAMTVVYLRMMTLQTLIQITAYSFILIDAKLRKCLSVGNTQF